MLKSYLRGLLIGAVATLCVLAFPGLVQAQTGIATVSWVGPTQYTDGTAIGPGELTGYTINWSQCSGTAPNYVMGAQSGTASVSATATSYTNNTLTTTWTIPHCFTVVANATKQAPDPTTGIVGPVNVSSVPSAVVFKLITPPAPPPAKAKTPTSVAVK